ncbi:cytochrome b/b6 domain-containing protein [Halolamina salifodinae]|uniref:Cytochrome b subunit of formate dehydrogenase n=1 Tax=Halolamina salifodinae TaxID=1202767 RepID=A0A8T4H1J6_9EURY|nr:cytochrome b/b6 domain-containing protein [Halolamina salifodinae]MBP1987188.1 cytochrome b subunit of formate dehydrogenase [Halolamina salifodinae]
MTNLDHGKFTRMTTVFHSLLAMDVFFLFFTGYAIMFNDELWWMLTLMGGSGSVAALHRVFGVGLLALVTFWVLMMVTTDTGRSNFRELMPTPEDAKAFVQDIQFVLGNAEERHPNARQFAGGTADEIPLLSYVGKGVIFIFAAELTMLSVSGLLIWSKAGLMQYFATQTAAMAFVVFHGLLGVVMIMGVMFHIFEHGFHPAFFPVETKAFIPRSMIPEDHEDDTEGTGIEQLELSPAWASATNLAGAATVIGIVSVMVASIYDTGFPVSTELIIGGGPSNLLLTVGVNMGVLVLFLGMVLSVYGNLVRIRWEQRMQEEADAESVDVETAD